MSAPPPFFKKTCPCTILPPPFKVFQIPPSGGGNQNLLAPLLNKNGLQVKPKTTLAKSNRTYDGFFDKTLSNQINRRKSQCFSSTSICKNVCWTSATMPIFPIRNLIKTSCSTYTVTYIHGPEYKTYTVSNIHGPEYKTSFSEGSLSTCTEA